MAATVVRAARAVTGIVVPEAKVAETAARVAMAMAVVARAARAPNGRVAMMTAPRPNSPPPSLPATATKPCGCKRTEKGSGKPGPFFYGRAIRDALAAMRLAPGCGGYRSTIAASTSNTSCI